MRGRLTTSSQARRAGHAGHRRAAVVLVAAAAVALSLAACSAGQHAATAKTVASVPGANADSADGTIGIRNALIGYDDPQGYAAGGSAPLIVRLFNNGQEPIMLTGVTSPAAARVVLVNEPSPGVTVSPLPASPTPSASVQASASTKASAQPSGSTQPTTSTQPSVPAAPTTPAPVGTPTLHLTIPAAGYLDLSPSSGRHLELTGLTQSVTPGTQVLVTFTFATAAGGTVQLADIAVPMAPPAEPATRTTINIEPTS